MGQQVPNHLCADRCVISGHKQIRSEAHTDLYAGPILESPHLRLLICDFEEGLARAPPTEVKQGRILPQHFSKVWRECAEFRAGKLTKVELETIEATTKCFLETVSADDSGAVDAWKLQLYMLESDQERLKAFRARLRYISAKSLNQLQKIFRLFHKYDCHSSKGLTTSTDLGLCLIELAPIVDLPEALLLNVTAELLRVVDVDSDGKIVFWQAVGILCGRRITPVEILLYDLSGGASDAFSELLLGQHFEAIYHSSVLAFGEEFWYGGKLYKSTPPQSKHFGAPLSTSVTELKPSAYEPDLHVVHIGFTLATYDEFKRWLKQISAKRFRLDNYDIVNWNCHSFSDEAVQFLTGLALPDSIRQMPELMMGTLETIPLLRPLLNKWLGGVETGPKSETAKSVASLRPPESAELIEPALQANLIVDKESRKRYAI